MDLTLSNEYSARGLQAQPCPPADKLSHVSTAPDSGNVTVYTASTSLSYDMLDDFDRRYASLMDDIAGIERRLGSVSDKMRV